MKVVNVAGGGLAGSEAAWQLAERGIHVTLFEARPVRPTPAHKTDRLAELVCSNSLKSNQRGAASWLVKEELRRGGSLLMRLADAASVPGGMALAVDRESFAESVTQAIEQHPLIELRREEFREIPVSAATPSPPAPLPQVEEGRQKFDSIIEGIKTGQDSYPLPLGGEGGPPEAGRVRGSARKSAHDTRHPTTDSLTLIATGPLTSDALAAQLQALSGSENLAFYDSISPIVDAETLDMSRIFRASRYGKGGEDYLNCPMTEAEYGAFYDALRGAEAVQTHEFEDANYFEACLPIEELARRGRETLCFGPMKPVGLVDPRTGRQPFAVVQLRAENLRTSSYNLVGFQNHLKFPEQKRILRMIPGLERAEFLRFGQIHRNTYINAPRLLNPDLSLRSAPGVFIAGQLSGVEGYVECIATGFLAGLAMASRANGETFVPPPRETALGSLVNYITRADAHNFQPANISFDLLPPMEGLPKHIARDRRARRELQCEKALESIDAWLGGVERPLAISHG
ncbi:MAG TPA: methylenetetrahydrofolate--tRNA-(uracil(54)-C(5))-methyltransferase (FADH(2)-oxidizing) TrmFO [Terriglobia bacterium]|nr:methylenetetrahydrofolate--tRNA-(uracil(54)-C(5))-methyltransferase (FADH(2)-oxidizing) TrmFO [Terriglobia bacterium]